jgi:hypothetical protein
MWRWRVEYLRHFAVSQLIAQGATALGGGRVRRVSSQRRCPRQESNLRTRFRKPLLYPLSYGGRLLRLAGPLTNPASKMFPLPGQALKKSTTMVRRLRFARKGLSLGTRVFVSSFNDPTAREVPAGQVVERGGGYGEEVGRQGI